jgi:hypothetical protein
VVPLSTGTFTEYLSPVELLATANALDEVFVAFRVVSFAKTSHRLFFAGANSLLLKGFFLVKNLVEDAPWVENKSLLKLGDVWHFGSFHR